ncbi:MAG: hypothetical protein H0U88_08655 [Chthoniobacterales bacterium]|nr:hypothetical protein [Chthoniobacterales bacterium]
MPSAPVWQISICALAVAHTGQAQLQEGATGDSIRVTVSMNQDGSRTAYEFDPANKKATATTTNSGGRATGKIHYQLDNAGRFGTGEVYDGKGRLQFKTVYRYEASGRLIEEARLTKDGAPMQKLVYAYDADGKKTGYSVYAADGKLLGSTKPVPSPPAVSKKK